MGLSQNVAVFRKSKGLTQEQLAEQCNVSRQAVTKWESGECEPSIEKLVALEKVFNISIDKFVTAEQDNLLKVEIDIDKVDYGLMEQCISMLNRARYFDCANGEHTKNRLLSCLYKSIKSKYINEKGHVREKYLVSNTQKDDREITIIFIEGFFQNENNPCRDYIQGNCEMDVVLDSINVELEKRMDNWVEVVEKKERIKNCKNVV